MVKSKKIKALSYINYGLFYVIKCLYFTLFYFIFFLFGHSLGAGAEICQTFSLVKKWFWNYLTFNLFYKKKMVIEPLKLSFLLPRFQQGWKKNHVICNLVAKRFLKQIDLWFISNKQMRIISGQWPICVNFITYT